jgi:ring-1,2-phenylacetyl-CoA epoxidase subunit PaaD
MPGGKVMATTQLIESQIWQALEQVKDPEIPVVSVVEMGIVRDVAADEKCVTVRMTPTFSGCPALHVIRVEIEAAVRRLTSLEVVVETVLYPPWSSDWISDSGRQKLKAFGLAPPTRHGGNILVTFYDPAACPYCESTNTTIKNDFGPTLCRAIHYCNNCRQPFGQFKAL